MFNESAVFPLDGRAARMMRSAGWSPEVIRSKSANPVNAFYVVRP
jgi:hypothetical protein